MADLAAEAARNMLQEGRIFAQYVSQGSEVEKKSIFLFYEPAPTASSLGSLCWCAPGSRVTTENSLSLNSLTDIFMGKQTEVLQSSEASEAIGDHCFSVVSKGQVLDIEADSRELFEAWTLGIESLMASRCVTVVDRGGAAGAVLPRLSTPSRPVLPLSPVTPVLTQPLKPEAPAQLLALSEDTHFVSQASFSLELDKTEPLNFEALFVQSPTPQPQATITQFPTQSQTPSPQLLPQTHVPDTQLPLQPQTPVVQLPRQSETPSTPPVLQPQTSGGQLPPQPQSTSVPLHTQPQTPLQQVALMQSPPSQLRLTQPQAIGSTPKLQTPIRASILSPQVPSATSNEDDGFSGELDFKPSTFALATPLKEASPYTRARGRIRPSLARDNPLLAEFRSGEEVAMEPSAAHDGTRLRESTTRMSMVNLLAQKEKRVQDLECKIARLAAGLNSPLPKQMTHLVHGSARAPRHQQRVGGLNLSKSELMQVVDILKRDTEIELEALKRETESSVLAIANAFNLQKKRMLGLEEKLRAETKRRKEAVEKVLDLQGSIRVFCRVRPLNAKELAEGDNAIVKVDHEESLLMTAAGESKRYTYDHVFGPQSTQEQVFAEVSPLVDACISGYTVCIFAYGQTGSGKTHTMEGSKNDRGVNYRALQYLFESCAEEHKQHPNLTHQVNVSVVEIYMEEVRDLLSQQGPGVKMDIREGADGPYVPGLEERVVTSAEEVQELMLHEAYPNRQVRGTSMNDRSSRSHCLVFVRCVVTNSTGIKTVGTLILIDLAGSERLKKSEAVGEAMKEAQAINKSLAALGNVIAALQQRSAHIPFRDSKLTFLLQNSLGGSCKCLMFCQIGPAGSNVQETSCSLTFANRVRATKLGQAKKHFATESKVAPETPGNYRTAEIKGLEQTVKNQADRIRELEHSLEAAYLANNSRADHEEKAPVERELQPENKKEIPKLERPLTRNHEVRREAFISSIHSETTRLDTKKKVAAPTANKTRAVLKEVKTTVSKSSHSSPKSELTPRNKRKAAEHKDSKDKENDEANLPSKSVSRSKSLSHVHKKPKQRAKKAATLLPCTMGRSKRFAF